MKYLISTYILLTMFLAGTIGVSAHTTLESSTPANESIVEPLDRLVLHFSTEIEAGKAIKVTNTSTNQDFEGRLSYSDDQMVLQLNSILTSGEYQVVWNIIGFDGHPVEGVYTFVVKEAEKTEDSLQNQIGSPEEKGERQPIQTEEVQNSSLSTSDSPVVWKIAMVLVLILLSSYFKSRI
ncbi:MULTISPECIES: copper resistance protein CopC [unclassified Exiguobacterium]|uniref:copper resistance CopC family protein n=1 Tax=unclassified Exiguobacterium TaxID=2644629 RepID=UPI001BE9EC17|nr:MULTISPECIES: copper resistance protein CopC [unclassified Exiguobacterium]